jgi:hypothetical protein
LAQEDGWLKEQVRSLDSGGNGDGARLEIARRIANHCRIRVEKHDPYTKEHSVRVATWSKVIASRLPTFDKQRIHRLEITALVHDYGKLYVPYDVLNKEGRLSAEEFEAVKRHPELGTVLLAPFREFLEMSGVLLHHVRYDGGGYPGRANIAGNDIPLEPRIIAVADAFDALTSDRSYRKGYTPERAFIILREVSGKQVDPALLTVFEQYYKSEKQAKGYDVGAKTLVLAACLSEEVRRARAFLRKEVGPFDEKSPLAKVADKAAFVRLAVDDLTSLSIDPKTADTIVRHAYKLPVPDTFGREDLDLTDAELERLKQSLDDLGPGHREVLLPLKRLRPEYRAVEIAVFHDTLWKCVADGLKMVLLR